MSQLYISSPVRSPRPRQADSSNSPLPGVAAQPVALRYRGAVLPPSTPKRLHFPHNPGSNTAANGAREIVTPASAYDTPREEFAAEAQAARREDEEHGATQLILLLTLSVVLLTLPWVVDHPVTLLVPVALFILPITSGALRSLASEGFSLISGGVRWFWRHRKTGRAFASARAGGAGAQPHVAPHQQPGVHHNIIQAGQHSSRQRQPQPASNLHALQRHPEPWMPNGAQLSYTATVGNSGDVHPRGLKGVQLSSKPPGPDARGGHVAPQGLEWQPVAQRTRPVAQQPAMCQQQPHTATGPELATPDLDFDSDGEAALHGEFKQARSGYVWGAQGLYAPGHVQGPPAQHAQRNPPYTKAPRPQSRLRSTDQAECTVYNWDEADECTHRRGHRSLSDLLNNVQ